MPALAKIPDALGDGVSISKVVDFTAVCVLETRRQVGEYTFIVLAQVVSVTETHMFSH